MDRSLSPKGSHIDQARPVQLQKSNNFQLSRPKFLLTNKNKCKYEGKWNAFIQNKSRERRRGRSQWKATKPTSNNVDVLIFISLNKQIDGILERLMIKQQRRYILKHDPCPRFSTSTYKHFQFNRVLQIWTKTEDLR